MQGKNKSPHNNSPNSLSRREFLKGVGTTAVAAAASQAEQLAAQIKEVSDEKVHGPEAVPVTLHVNGEKRKLVLEPRVTLLEAIREHLNLTGQKEVCDRGTCGACTVMVDGVPQYSCMKLAVDSQNEDITTVEGLSSNGQLNKVQQAFIECDSLMCGYCTPGFVVNLTALLDHNPKPSEADVREACSGNLCRCGTYPRIFDAALKAAGVKTKSRVQILSAKDIINA